ncbi:MAG TPA: sugar MFS transporter [Steroidobacteraceae bacterium]|nr:sugar MFS transporter [Steroidobacteraceae bacterium]
MSIAPRNGAVSSAGRGLRGFGESAGDAAHADAPDLRLFVFALFFIFGGITSLNDVVIPKLKGLFTLKYGEVMLVQSAFFAAYFVFSVPAAVLVRRVGYMRGAVIGLLLMAAGCVLFVPASAAGVFATFLAALFVLAAGITVIQVVANPLISVLGPPATAHSRLTFAQAFNSLGTTVFPYIGSILILGSISNVDPSRLSGAALTAFRAQESHLIVRVYIGLAAAIVAVAAVVFMRRDRLAEVADVDHSVLGHPLGLLRRPRFGYGVLCIFLYVGAEVAIGSLIVSYLMQSEVLGLGAEAAGKHVPFYWGGAMVGRFIGAYLLRLISPGKLLAFNAAVVLALLLTSANSSGAAAGWSLLAVGLFNSIMFPTIFSLASEGLGARAKQGSGLLSMAIVGGAIVPFIAGHVADWRGLQFALWVPAVCYAGILGFGAYARRPLAGGA